MCKIKFNRLEREIKFEMKFRLSCCELKFKEQDCGINFKVGFWRSVSKHAIKFKPMQCIFKFKPLRRVI